MHQPPSLPPFIRSWVGAAMMLAGIGGQGSIGWASCGDYLIHGAADLQEGVEEKWQWDATAAFGVQPNSEAPLQPTAPCVGGRCQSLPFPPPAPLANSLSVSELIALADHSSGVSPGAGGARWLLPGRGVFPVQPWLAVDVPPPKVA